MNEPIDIEEPQAGSRFGCLLVLVPLTAFFLVMPDAIHVWSSPWAEPLLWLFAGIATWFVLRWLIDGPLKTLGDQWRLLVCFLLLITAIAFAVQIYRSV